MYSDAFCKVYNQFGWNYFPEAFGEQLLTWLHQYQITVHKSLDLPAARACSARFWREMVSRPVEWIFRRV